jgi:hypothetical protein
VIEGAMPSHTQSNAMTHKIILGLLLFAMSAACGEDVPLGADRSETRPLAATPLGTPGAAGSGGAAGAAPAGHAGQAGQATAQGGAPQAGAPGTGGATTGVHPEVFTWTKQFPCDAGMCTQQLTITADCQVTWDDSETVQTASAAGSNSCDEFWAHLTGSPLISELQSGMDCSYAGSPASELIGLSLPTGELQVEVVGCVYYDLQKLRKILYMFTNSYYGFFPPGGVPINLSNLRRPWGEALPASAPASGAGRAALARGGEVARWRGREVARSRGREVATAAAPPSRSSSFSTEDKRHSLLE